MRKVLSILLCLLILPAPAWGAVVFDASSTVFQEAGVSASMSHTTSGSDRVLLACVFTSSNVTHNAPTYNAVAMTQIGSVLTTDTNTKQTFWYLIAPTTGANTLAMTFSDDVGLLAAAAVSLTGVDQTTAIGTAVSNTADPGETIAVTVSSAIGEEVVDCFHRHADDIPTMNAGGGQTVRASIDSTGEAIVNMRMSQKAGAASVEMSWSWDASFEFAGLFGVPLKPAAAPAAPSAAPLVIVVD